ncbi:hypothetical protein ElyMa_003096600 [Elysia marginata]|uniref:Uncharacterized protein n=1 Tax=Elysia marginata TaxID=1093978 RepID=A0AAV4IR30_9GAST|nr:hypothetical protein ElyMa_003096600 [Elysia marginata]
MKKRLVSYTGVDQASFSRSDILGIQRQANLTSFQSVLFAYLLLQLCFRSFERPSLANTGAAQEEEVERVKISSMAILKLKDTLVTSWCPLANHLMLKPRCLWALLRHALSFSTRKVSDSELSQNDLRYAKFGEERNLKCNNGYRFYKELDFNKRAFLNDFFHNNSQRMPALKHLHHRFINGWPLEV